MPDFETAKCKTYVLFFEAFFLLILDFFLWDDHVDGFGKHLKIKRRIVEVFALCFHQQGMRRNRHDLYPFSSECFHFIDFMDESAVVEVFHIGSKLKDGNFLMTVTSNKPSFGTALGIVIIPPPLKRPLPMERFRI